MNYVLHYCSERNGTYLPTARQLHNIRIFNEWFTVFPSQVSWCCGHANLICIIRANPSQLPALMTWGLVNTNQERYIPWWRHRMETFSALLALCMGNSPVTGEFPSQRPVARSFEVFFDLRPNKRLSKPSWCSWFETPSPPLWLHCNVYAA